AAEDDVPAAAQRAVEPDTERQQRAHPAVDHDAALARGQDAGHRSHEGRLAGTVGANQTEDRAVRDVERDALDGLHHPDTLLAVLPAPEPEDGVAERRGGL